MGGEGGLDRRGQYPELRNVYHYEQNKPGLPDRLAAAGLDISGRGPVFQRPHLLLIKLIHEHHL